VPEHCRPVFGGKKTLLLYETALKVMKERKDEMKASVCV
jgi:hypothetical protein